MAELVVPRRIYRTRRPRSAPDRFSGSRARTSYRLPRERHRDGRALCGSHHQPLLEERVRRRRIRPWQARECSSSSGATAWAYPLFRRSGGGRSGGAFVMRNAVCMHEEDYGVLWKHDQFRNGVYLEVRRSRRLVCQFLRDGRQLRLRLLLVPLPGRHHPARGQAHRHHPDGGDCAGQVLSVGRHGGDNLGGPTSPAFLQRSPAHDARWRWQHRHRTRVPAAAVGHGQSLRQCVRYHARRVLSRERDAVREADGRDRSVLEDHQSESEEHRRQPDGLQAPGAQRAGHAGAGRLLHDLARQVRHQAYLGDALRAR